MHMAADIHNDSACSAMAFSDSFSPEILYDNASERCEILSYNNDKRIRK